MSVTAPAKGSNLHDDCRHGKSSYVPVVSENENQEQQSDADVDETYAPDRNKSGRRSRAIEGDLLSCFGAAEWPHHPSDSADVEAFLREIIRSPEYAEFAALIDAEPSRRVTGYSYLPSQKLGVCLVSLISSKHDLKAAHRYVQTEPEIRSLLGFEPMSPEVREGSLLQGLQTPLRDPDFPSRQAIVKFIDQWVRARADWLIPTMHAVFQKVAFRTIIENDLNTGRIVLDTASCYSGLKRQGKVRHDEGALHWSHGKGYFGRQWGTATLSDGGGLMLYARPETPRDEGGLAREVFIPTLGRLSDDLKAYAAEYGIPNHPGFERAGLFGDSHFGDVETAEVAYQHGFEPGFTSLEAGNPRKIVGKKHLQIKGPQHAPRRYANLDMDNRGRIYCSCDARQPLKKRRPMAQITNRFGIDFLVHCTHCRRSNICYRLTRRGPDKELANNRWKRGEPSNDFRALRHDDPRVIAVAHHAREEHESRHSGLRHMGLLAKERLSQRKHITGNLRHDFWYALGAIVQNVIINWNFAAGRVSREVLDWKDAAASGLRNGFAAVKGKRRKREARAASAAQNAAIAQRLRNTSSPPVRDAA